METPQSFPKVGLEVTIYSTDLHRRELVAGLLRKLVPKLEKLLRHRGFSYDIYIRDSEGDIDQRLSGA